jgi:hypothetical protein
MRDRISRIRHGEQVMMAVICVLALTSCAIRNGTGPNAPPPTPFQQVVTWNTALAEANNAIAKGVVNANAAGSLSDQVTNSILIVQSRIADADRNFTGILQAGQAAAGGQAAQIKALLAKIQEAALSLQGDIGVKDPATLQLVQTNIRAILTFVSQIVQALANVGVLPAGTMISTPRAVAAPSPGAALPMKELQ